MAAAILTEHPVERQPRLALLRLVGDDDLVLDLAFDQALEHPEQVIRRHPEHRRAQAAERIERDDGSIGRDLVGEPVDEMHLGRDRPDAADRALRHDLDDPLGRSALVRRLHDVERALRVRDDLALGILLPERVDLLRR